MKKLLMFLLSMLFALNTFAQAEGSKRIALTFDDGPRGKITESILEVLKENEVKATFFVLGENGKRYPKILERIRDEGHQLTNHSYNHPNFAKMDVENVKKQLDDTNKIIEKVIGKKNYYYRPPYGSITKSQKENIRKNMDMISVMWNVCPEDWKKTVNTEFISTFLIENAKNNGIVLLHDYQKTAEALKTAIPELKNKGYEFITIEELIGK